MKKIICEFYEPLWKDWEKLTRLGKVILCPWFILAHVFFPFAFLALCIVLVPACWIEDTLPKLRPVKVFLALFIKGY